MKLAIISDIHGNLPALNAVLDDAKRRGITEFVFAGDYCLSGPYPDECLAAIAAIDHARIVRGNEEKYLENLVGKDPREWTDGQMQVTYWSFRKLSQEHLRFLSALPCALDFQVNGVTIRLAHHSAAWIGDCEFRLVGPDVLALQYEGKDMALESVRRDIHNILAHDPEFRSAVSGLEAGVYIFGHSHIQWNWQDPERKVYLVNPGSCGLPLDWGHNTVPYTVLTIPEDGNVEIEEVRVPFDKQEYIEFLKTTEQYREANVWTKVIANELLKTREHMTFFLQFAEQYAQRISDPRRPYAVETWENAFRLWNSTLPDPAIND